MEEDRPRGNPLKWRGGRSAWGAPLCCVSSEMSPHRLLAPPRGASPGADGAPKILGGPNPQAADRRKGGAPLREANKVMRSPPSAPGGRGWPGAWLCQLAHPMAPRIGHRSLPRQRLWPREGSRRVAPWAGADSRRPEAGVLEGTWPRADKEDARPRGNPEGRRGLGARRRRGSSLMPPASSSSPLLAMHPRALASRQRSSRGQSLHPGQPPSRPYPILRIGPQMWETSTGDEP